MKLSNLLPILLCLAAVPLAAGDNVYRWVDAEGVTHFSDRAPDDAASVTTIEIPDYAPPPEPAFSYVQLLQRLEALERAGRENEPDPPPARPPVIVQPVHTIERTAYPAFIPHRPVHRPDFPARPAPDRAPTSAFDRLFEARSTATPPPDN